nr:MAG: RNA-dependent RNA polymerase [Leptosphaeria biglobosa negative single-stranded RNA virus 1]
MQNKIKTKSQDKFLQNIILKNKKSFIDTNYHKKWEAKNIFYAYFIHSKIEYKQSSKTEKQNYAVDSCLETFIADGDVYKTYQFFKLAFVWNHSPYFIKFDTSYSIRQKAISKLNKLKKVVLAIDHNSIRLRNSISSHRRSMSFDSFPVFDKDVKFLKYLEKVFLLDEFLVNMHSSRFYFSYREKFCKEHGLEEAKDYFYEPKTVDLKEMLDDNSIYETRPSLKMRSNSWSNYNIKVHRLESKIYLTDNGSTLPRGYLRRNLSFQLRTKGISHIQGFQLFDLDGMSSRKSDYAMLTNEKTNIYEIEEKKGLKYLKFFSENFLNKMKNTKFLNSAGEVVQEYDDIMVNYGPTPSKFHFIKNNFNEKIDQDFLMEAFKAGFYNQIWHKITEFRSPTDQDKFYDICLKEITLRRHGSLTYMKEYPEGDVSYLKTFWHNLNDLYIEKTIEIKKSFPHLDSESNPKNANCSDEEETSAEMKYPEYMYNPQGIDWAETVLSDSSATQNMSLQRKIETILNNIKNRDVFDAIYPTFSEGEVEIYMKALIARNKIFMEDKNTEILMIEWVCPGPFEYYDYPENPYEKQKTEEEVLNVIDEVNLDYLDKYQPDLNDEEFYDKVVDMDLEDEFLELVEDAEDESAYLILKKQFISEHPELEDDVLEDDHDESLVENDVDDENLQNEEQIEFERDFIVEEPDLKTDILVLEDNSFKCLTSYHEGKFNIELLPGVYTGIVGQVFNGFSLSCLENMYIEFITCLKNWGNVYHSKETDEVFNAFFENSVALAFHFRHDVYSLAAGFLFSKSHSNNFGVELKFSEVFEDFPSDRTPDKIYVKDKTVIIIETSVTSDEKKSFFQKGTNEFDSKYAKEINMLKIRGFDVHYTPHVLDVTTGYDNFNEVTKALDDLDVEFNRNESYTLHKMVKNLILSNRGFERFGYIAFGEQVVWSDYINKQGKTVKDIFLKRLNAMPIPDRNVFFLKMNRKAYERLLINGDVLRNDLFNKKYDRFKKIVCIVTDKTIFFKSDMEGCTPSYFMENLNSTCLHNLINYVFLNNSRVGSKARCDLIPPFHSFLEHSKAREDETIKPHDHSQKSEMIHLDNAKKTNKRIAYEIEPIKSWEWDLAIESNKGNFLGDKLLNENCLDNASKIYNENIPLIKDHNHKSAFTLPFVDAQNLRKTDDFISDFEFDNTPTYNLIYEKFKSGKFLRHKLPNSVRDKMRSLNKTYNITAKSLSESFDESRLTFKQIKKLVATSSDDFIKEEFMVLTRTLEEVKETQELAKKDKVKNENKLVKLSTVELESIKNEYSWVDKKFQNVNRNYFVDDEKEVVDIFQDCMDYLTSNSNKNYMDDYINNLEKIGEDSEGTKKLNQFTVKHNHDVLNEACSLNVTIMADFINKFIYTLCFFSKMSMKGNEFSYSNLGFEDTNLIVRGGKSVNQTGDSRQFRLSFIIPEFIYEKRRQLYSTSYTFAKKNGKFSILTPWMNLHEKVLADMISFKEKVVFNLNCYISRTRRETSLDGINLKNIAFNLMLCFNNRRQTETMLSDLRYPIVNSLGAFSGIEELVASLPNTASDLVQAFIILRLKKYSTFAKLFRKRYLDDEQKYPAKHLFTLEDIQGDTDLTYMIYSTYMMTKAPYKQAVEQAKNLSSMMGIHQKFVDLTGSDDLSVKEMLDKTECDEGSKIFDNDFYFSPKYSFQLGKNLADRLVAEKRAVDVSNDFYQTFTKGWYIIENDSGLRSNKLTRKGEDSFFGRKSHEVVAREVLNDLEKSKSPKIILDEIYSNNGDIFQKSKLLQQYEVSFIKKINDQEVKKLYFHVVDKTQWKGSREIYVMTLNTKLLLNPLEQFFKKLCQKTENEIISVASNKRLNMIHSQFYENSFIKEGKDKYHKYNLSLDCRKWGPQTNFNKYMYFVLGMSSILPEEFINYFCYITGLYVEKEVIVSKNASEIFTKNLRYEGFLKFLKDEPGLETKKFNMPYSFVMGIFNYLSSLYHAEGQTFNINEIQKIINKKHGVDVILRMNAHSDDSGGYLMVPIQKNTNTEEQRLNIVSEVLKYYEAMFKFGNIFFSTKKCVVSKSYFELLSILYLNDKLLPMVPKFFGSMTLHPKLEGYSADMNEGYSKVIELLCNGATFEEAYFAMRMYSEMVRGFYHLKNNDTDRPVAAYGGLYSHPLLILLTGSRADNIRLFFSDKEKFLRYQSALLRLTGERKETFNQTGLKSTNSLVIKRRSIKDLSDFAKKLFGNYIIPSLNDRITIKDDWSTLEYSVSGEGKVSEVYDDFIKIIFDDGSEKILNIPDNVKITRDVDLTNHLTRILTLVNAKLKDPSFVNSLSYVSNTRRLTETFTWCSDVPVFTTSGLITQKMAPALISAVAGFENPEDAPFSISSELISVDKLDVLFNDVLGEAEALYTYMSESVKGQSVFSLSNNNKVKVKPAHLDVMLNLNSIKIQGDPVKIFYSDSDISWMMSLDKSYKREKKFINDRLNSLGFLDVDFAEFTHYARVLNKTHERDIHMYAYVASGNREIQDFMDIVSLLETNSFFGQKITKLFKQVKYNQNYKNVTEKIDPQFQTCMEILSVLHYLESYHKDCNPFYKGQPALSWIEENSGVASSTLIPKYTDDMSAGNLYWFYGWLKPQRYIDGKWGGQGELIFISWNSIWLCRIKNNSILSFEVNVNPSSVNFGFETKMLFVLLTRLNIKIYENVSSNTTKFCMSNPNNPVIRRENECETNFGLVELNESLDYIYTQNVEKVSNFVYRMMNVKLMHMCVEFELNLSMKDLSNLPESVLNLNKSESDAYEKKLNLIQDFPEPPIYEALIKNKLNDNFEFLNLLKKYCQDNDLKFEPLQSKEFKEILGMDLEREHLPDDVYWLLLNSDSKQKINDNFDTFLSEFIKTKASASDDLDWIQFMSKWGDKATIEGSLKISSQTNSAWYDDCYMLAIEYNQIAKDSLNVIESSLIKMMKLGLGRELCSPDFGEFQQVHTLDSDFLSNFFYVMKQENSLNHYVNSSRYQSRLSEFIFNIIITIFSDDFYFEKFISDLKKDPILSTFPISKTSPKRFAVAYHALYSAYKMESNQRFLLLEDLNNYEKNIRKLESTGSTLVTSTTKHAYTNMFIYNLPKTLTVKRKNKNDFELGLKNAKYISEGFSHPNFPYLFEMSKVEISETKDLYLNSMSELLNFLNDMLQKEPKRFKPREKPVGGSGEKGELPVIETIGAPTISELSKNYSSFLLISTALPQDLILYRDLISIHLGPMKFKNKNFMNNIVYYILFNCEINVGRLSGLYPYNKFYNDSINYLAYFEEDKVYKDSYLKAKVIVDVSGTSKVVKHNHDCGVEYKKYNTNDKFEECFFITLDKSHVKVSEDDLKKVKAQISHYKNKGESGRMVLTYMFEKILKELENKMSFEEMIEKAFSEFMLSGLEDLSKIDYSGLKRSNFRNWKPGKNKYSPINKNTKLFANLETIFGDKTEKYLNRGFALTNKNKNKLLMSLESKRLLYNSLYNKTAINTQDIRKYRLFIAFMKKLISSSTLVENDDDDFENLNTVVSTLDKEILDEVDNLEKYLSDDESDFEYI